MTILTQAFILPRRSAMDREGMSEGVFEEQPRDRRMYSGKSKFVAGIFMIVILAGLYLIWRRYDESVLSDRVSLVCVESGDIFVLARAEIRTLPARNPDTGESTLVPCVVDREGTLRVDDAFKHALQEMGERNQYVDRESLQVRSKS